MMASAVLLARLGHDAERVIRARMACPTPPGGMRGTCKPGGHYSGVAEPGLRSPGPGSARWLRWLWHMSYTVYGPSCTRAWSDALTWGLNGSPAGTAHGEAGEPDPDRLPDPPRRDHQQAPAPRRARVRGKPRPAAQGEQDPGPGGAAQAAGDRPGRSRRRPWRPDRPPIGRSEIGRASCRERV